MKYIVINAGHEWNRYCWSGVKNLDNIRFIHSIFNPMVGRFWNYHFFRSDIFIRLFWIPYIQHILNISSEPITLIVYDWGPITLSRTLIAGLRKNHPNLKIVYVFTNIVKITGATTHNLFGTLKDDYDIVFAFDPQDAKKYGFEYSKLIYTAKLPEKDDSSHEYDIFYVGQAKDRHEKLIEIFKDAVSAGLKCRFYIHGVPENEQFLHNDIIYNQRLSYGEVLDYMGKSKCIVDAIQGESAGLTIKTCEAVVLDRKLITTNENVVNEPFFKPSNILVYKKGVDLKSFMDTEFIPYTEKDRYEFSPQRLFHQIEDKVAANDVQFKS